MKVSKDSVNYQQGDMKGHHCGNCVMFHPTETRLGTNNDIGTCDLVRGPILEHAVCDKWEAKVNNKSEDLDMLAAQLPKIRSQMRDIRAQMDIYANIGRTDPELEARYWNFKKTAYPMLVKLWDAGYQVNPVEYGWSLDSLNYPSLRSWLCKSEQTPRVSTEHHPLGTHGLWQTPSKKVPEKQQLPAYFQNTARALMRDHGMGESEAIATAINAVKAWAQGKAFGGKTKVTPEVQEAAQKALEEWEKLKESHH